ncbi:TonB-dependent receptor [Novosphingobium sp. B 225]|uniref:TonB-dependent receptor n=1 Tax=Novosphingobium sp. B 225 TaxID=1961849 RepID=UPI000B4AF7C6|nr:TonB-dependent receptor [Novosphingobium sp. B 225]
MRVKLTLLAGACAGAIAFPAYAQDKAAEDNSDGTEIIVTAQRTNQRLQDVPIAVSAFNSEALEKQQIKNTSDLQLTLPNVTFTKTNFTSASFTIRGIGDLCVGVTCDSATAIHLNDAPLFGTRLFEGEFYDLSQVEVLRGPQGTLFGRNATSGVVNFRTARPDLSGMGASAEAEYGNYNGVKFKGMVNAPLSDAIGVRLSGFYLNRDGYTKNLYDNSRIDDRDMYGLRGSLRIEPGTGTTIDVMAQYFHERDSRMRIQKQLCQRDPTGVMGCLNGGRPFETTNANTTFVGVLTSREFFATQGLPTALALGSIYGADPYAGVVNPADYRTVDTDTNPSYYTQEWIVQGSIDQELGENFSLKLGGNWQKVDLDSSQDYNNSVQNRAGFATALNTLAVFAANGIPTGIASPAFVPGSSAYFAPIAAALMPNGPNGALCTSLPEETGTGAFGGHKVCGSSPLDFDRSNQNQSSWSTEAILSSKFDGPFNFLIGGIYAKLHLTENSYYVDSFGIDYFTGLVGAFTSFSNSLPPSYLATPTYRNNSDDIVVKSHGIFGEAYYQFNDKMKLTLGLRYNNDEKDITARTTLASFLAPFSSTNAYASPFIGSYDADAGTAGNQLFQTRKVKFSEWTGRAVLDYQITPDNLLYFSYSRGYKSGGINPPLSPVFSVPESFKPEFVDAFEMGSKNNFGPMQLNLTGFYYKYKDLQLSRIVARTSVNDNVSATIYGLEAEAVFRPSRELSINMNASYLNAKVSQDKMLANPRDFGGGRADSVIIKDLTNGANCAVAPNTAGNAAGANGFVNQVNTIINAGLAAPLKAGAGLRPTTAFPTGSGLASTGAFSVCAVLSALAPTLGAASFGGVTVFSSGIPVNIKNNKLPGAPDYKFSAGVQYAAPLGGDMTLTPRADFIYTGKSFGNIFNGTVNEIPSFTQVNAQLQLDGPDKKWYARAWVQNLFDKDSITGLYVTDQSSGNYTNIFTLEPRRYGITAGVKF